MFTQRRWIGLTTKKRCRFIIFTRLTILPQEIPSIVFLVVKVGNNHWVYEYKIVHIVTTKQIRFFGLPKTDDTYVTSDMERIIRALSSIEFVRFVFNESQRERIENILGGIRRSKRMWNHDEFFYYIDSDNEYFTSNRWKKKHYVNLLNRTSAFSHDVSRDINIAETNNLRETWKIGMEKRVMRFANQRKGRFNAL